ncbi:MAG: asparagine synthase (glutamine-hydrolyzing) [Ktedonobacterales bacterium]|nr:asparagine synthase (glutamine-hydrolyzing) [Ktedonobacterales bacterium]
MCGICGVLGLDGHLTIAEPVLRRMSAAQHHRGPDDEGFFRAPGVGFGFQRLAILDLTPTGHQPMTNEDESLWLIFNGEIYNYRELVPELERAGHQFRSRSDSEVILHGYEQWGTECLQRFNGMFAFAIWDRRARRVFIARDRLGVKPLYYWSDGELFAFGSELKSLLALPQVPRELDTDALRAYLTYEYVPTPRSIFRNIAKLPAGHALEIPLDGTRAGARTADWRPHSYWNVQFGTDAGSHRTLDEYAEELRSLLRAAVARRLISDVPLGAFLSGGIDSSCVVALMAEVGTERPKTFSIGFAEETFSELRYAEMVARRFNTEHHVEILNPDARELIAAVADALDEPFADASALPTYLVSRMARQHVTVALAGDAGDELFAGYDWYRAQRLAAATVDRLPESARGRLRALAAHISPTPKKKGPRNIARRLLEGTSLPAALQQVRWQTFWQAGDLSQVLVSETDAPASDRDAEVLALLAGSGSAVPLDQQQYADIKRYLPDDILVKVDRMSMAVSLETRGPFLDYTLVEFAARLPAALRLHGLDTKYLLKYAMRDLLPDAIIHRPKLGFNIPYKNWLRQELRDLMREALAPARLRAQGIFQPAYVDGLVREHLAGTRDHAHQLWQLLMFELWSERYLTSASSASAPAGELYAPVPSLPQA